MGEFPEDVVRQAWARANGHCGREDAKQEEVHGKLIIESVKKREDNPHSRIAKYYAGIVTAKHSMQETKVC